MVEKNTTNNDGAQNEPKKRSRLFGSRRASKTASAPAPLDAPAEANAADFETVSPVSDAPANPEALGRIKSTDDDVAASAPAKRAPARRATAKRSGASPDPAETSSAEPDTAEPDTAESHAAEPHSAVKAPTSRTRSRKSATPPAEVSVEVSTDAPTVAPSVEEPQTPLRPTTSLLFQAPDLPPISQRQGTRDDDRDARDSRFQRNDDRSGGRNDRGTESSRNESSNRNDNTGRNDRNGDQRSNDQRDENDEPTTLRRRSRRRAGDEDRDTSNDQSNANPTNTVVKVRSPRPQQEPSNEPTRVRGSTRLEAKKQRRRDGRDAGRRRPVITEAEFIARRESVDRMMVVRSRQDRIQIGVLEDGVLVEHYVAKAAEASLIGNVYLGRVQNVLPSMEAAFVDIGRGRNAVLYSGEVDWEAAAENSADGKTQARRIELALKPGDKVLVQVTKDPVGHKGARLTSQVSLPGRYLVYVPNGSMNGISRKLPDTERARLKKILKEVLPENVGVIVRTAAEGATDEQLTLDVNRLTAQWATLSETLDNVLAPALLHSEPDLLVKIVRDVFNEDFQKLIIDGEDARATISTYLSQVAPDLVERLETYESSVDSFDEYRITEQIEKALDRKVWLPSGGSLVIDRTEAMTVVDVNTGKFVGSGGNLEETVTKNNLEAAEEIVRQLRLRDIGGIIVVDFIDMVLESNRDLVLRRLVECLSRDRTKHQVAEVTSLGLIQMTRKKLGLGLIESFSEACESCAGRGIIIHHDPLTKHRQSAQPETRRTRGKGSHGGGATGGSGSNDQGRSNNQSAASTGASANSGSGQKNGGTHAITDDVKNALAQIAASTIAHSTANAETTAVNEIAVATAASEPAAIGAAGTPSDATADGAVADGAVDNRSTGEITDDEVSVAVDLTAGESSSSRSGGSRRGSGRRGGQKNDAPSANGHKRVQRTPDSLPNEPLVFEPLVFELPSRVEEVTVAAAEAAVEILDIPIKKNSQGPRRISTRDAEQILDSVLDALPEPKLPGQGRSRVSRRASSSGTVRTSDTSANSSPDASPGEMKEQLPGK